MGQKLTTDGKKVQAKQVGPKINNRWKKGSSEAGWTKNNLLKKGWAKNTTDGKKVQANQVGTKINNRWGAKITRVFYIY